MFVTCLTTLTEAICNANTTDDTFGDAISELGLTFEEINDKLDRNDQSVVDES